MIAALLALAFSYFISIPVSLICDRIPEITYIGYLIEITDKEYVVKLTHITFEFEGIPSVDLKVKTDLPEVFEIEQCKLKGIN